MLKVAAHNRDGRHGRDDRLGSHRPAAGHGVVRGRDRDPVAAGRDFNPVSTAVTTALALSKHIKDAEKLDAQFVRALRQFGCRSCRGSVDGLQPPEASR